MKRLLISTLLAFAPLCAAEDTLERFNTLISGLKDTQGEFKQTTYELDGSELQSSAGTFAIARPNKLRWETSTPWPQLLVVNDHTVWLYDPDFEQATYSELNAQNQANPALLFSGDIKAIEQSYVITSADEGYLLEPKDANAQYRQLKVLFEADKIRAISYYDFAGQRTSIEFSKMVELAKPSTKLFTFVPPEGVEVVIGE